jgi:hypothetical protein
MMHHVLQRLSVARFIEMYIGARSLGELPISIPAAIQAVRTALPRCEMTDEQLQNIVEQSLPSQDGIAFRNVGCAAEVTARTIAAASLASTIGSPTP